MKKLLLTVAVAMMMFACTKTPTETRENPLLGEWNTPEGVPPFELIQNSDYLPAFEEGIKLTIKWFFEHEDWMKNVTSGDYQKYYEDMYAGK